MDGGRIDSAKDHKLRWSHSTNARWHATETTRPQYTYLPTTRHYNCSVAAISHFRTGT